MRDHKRLSLKCLRGVALFALVATTATAAELGGLYVGGGLGSARYDIDYGAQVRNAYSGSAFTTVESADLTRSSDFGYKAFTGYQFIPPLALELSYVDLGKPKAHYDLSTTLGLYTRDATYKIQGLNLAAVGTLPLSDAFSVHGSVGAFYSELKYSESGTDAPDNTPNSFTASNRRRTDLSFGLGLTYRLRDQWAIRGDWDRFRNIGSEFALNADGNGRFSNVDLFTLNVIYLLR
jgi:OmpA-OmpF porin, OOP family